MAAMSELRLVQPSFTNKVTRATSFCKSLGPQIAHDQRLELEGSCYCRWVGCGIARLLHAFAKLRERSQERLKSYNDDFLGFWVSEVLRKADKPDHQAWFRSLSETQRVLVCLARALITNAEVLRVHIVKARSTYERSIVLCVEKPAQLFCDSLARDVLALLREHVRPWER
eukprot:5049373-Amphidinium_carterae.1